MKLIAKTLHGFEALLAEELSELGASQIHVLKRAVAFEGDQALLYRANYLLRTAIRIIKPIYHFTAFNERELYRGIQEIDWSKYMDVDDTLAIDALCSSEFFQHSKYVALKSKDAIVDQFRNNTGRRPNVELREPNLRINIRIWNEEVTVSLDSSNDSLHRRGYRKKTEEAPISEVLAAGLILLTGWKGDCTFIDPMCGSGTILIEAAMIAQNIPAQYFRDSFGFQGWKDFDEELWNTIVRKANKNRKVLTHPILGFDISYRAIQTAKLNIRAAKMEGQIQLEQKAFQDLTPTDDEGGIIVTNPPYDERLREGNIVELYKSIGDQLKTYFAGFNAWILSANLPALKRVGLRPSRKINLFNGALACKFQCFELYKGTRKKSKVQ